MLFQLLITMWSESPPALEVKQSSVGWGRKEGGCRVWHGSVDPVCLCSGICTGQHKGASVLSETHSSSLTIDSASLMVIIPPLCLPSSAAHLGKLPLLLSCRSLLSLPSPLASRLHLPLLSSPPFAVYRSSPGWIIHGSSLCQMASALLIQKDSFH